MCHILVLCSCDDSPSTLSCRYSYNNRSEYNYAEGTLAFRTRGDSRINSLKYLGEQPDNCRGKYALFPPHLDGFEVLQDVNYFATTKQGRRCVKITSRWWTFWSEAPSKVREWRRSRDKGAVGFSCGSFLELVPFPVATPPLSGSPQQYPPANVLLADLRACATVHSLLFRHATLQPRLCVINATNYLKSKTNQADLLGFIDTLKYT